MVAINYKKLNSQIKLLNPEATKGGYIFLATDEQANNFINSVAFVGSKSKLRKKLMILIKTDEDWRREFLL